MQTTSATTVSTALMTELAQRTGILYKPAYISHASNGRGCLALVANLRELKQFGENVENAAVEAQQQGDLPRMLEIRDLVNCLTSIRCDSTEKTSLYYWPNITVR